MIGQEFLPVQSGQAGPFSLGEGDLTKDNGSCAAYIWVFPDSDDPLDNVILNYNVVAQ